MNPLTHSILLLSLAIGTTITLTSQHWILAWIGLEINTLAIIPLMTKNFHPRAVEAATKYFLTQATASALILMSCLFNAWKMGEWEISSMTHPATISVISIALMMKLGLAPMHFWMPDVLQGISLPTGLILSTWQKIAPMMLLYLISNHTNLYVLTSMGFLSILIGGWGGIGQTQMRKIMAFSSIGHLGWTVIILKLNPYLALYNFILYVAMTTMVFLSLIASSTTDLSRMSTSWAKSPALTLSTLLMFLSLAGLPPLSGFSPKLMISLELVKQGAILLTLLINLASLLALYFYLRLTYIMLLTSSPNVTYAMCTWRTATKFRLQTFFTYFMALFAFPLTPVIALLM
uniref:NADH-ubiquinone oxidoreductase chain 2 n=1 Tax=Ptychadena mascareniensis TaxID=88031 RepID=S4V1B3_9NEOB|nr:NADH dehydrogenase subunit 2 [Ptychadena mascareniensis]